MNLSVFEDTNNQYLDQARLVATDTSSFKDCETRAITTIGVVGAGTMGRGIAMSAISSGLDVTLFDTNPDVIEAAAKWIRERIQRAIAKSEERGDGLKVGLFQPVLDMSALRQCDLVIEAVPEIMEAKQAVFRKLDKICRSGAILATNTSTLDVDLIAEVTTRPEDVIGLHFFSPAHVMRLLEIVAGKLTSRAVLATSAKLAHTLAKTGVRVGNCYGFAGNRMIEGFGREANLLLLEGNTPVEIDTALRDFGFAMGALEVADLVGIDVPYAARQGNPNKSEDPTYYRIADMLVNEGALGQKTGLGYYEHLPDGSKRTNLRISALVVAEAQRLNVRQLKSSAAEIVDRCVLPIINEGLKILDEGLADRASDLDVIMTLGYGFPSATGGPMRYADTRGSGAVLEGVERYQSLYGEAWAPALTLKALVRDQKAISRIVGYGA